MELKVIDGKGQVSASMSASDELFGRDYNEALIHQVVIAYQANARFSNSKQKGRSEIAKSTRKPWAQKGTGRARAGMASSPLWRGGGKIFRTVQTKITRRRSTARCIALAWLPFFRNWFVRIV